MSCTSMCVRGYVKVLSGVTLGAVVEALMPLMSAHQMEFDPNFNAGGFGGLDMEQMDDCVDLIEEDGRLNFALNYTEGMRPAEGLEESMNALAKLVEPSYIEIIDLDASPSNDDAVGVHYLGVDEHAKKIAQVNYAFCLLNDYAGGLIPSDLILEFKSKALSHIAV